VGPGGALEAYQKAKEEGLQEQPFGEANATADDTGQLTMGYMGLVFKYGSEKIVWPMNPGQRDGLEFWITNKIREIRDKNDEIKHRIAVITGKDELKLSDNNLVARQGRGGAPSLKSIIDQAFPFYTVEELDLADGADPIDKELEGLIITQPQKEYTEKDLRRIDECLMLGNKSLAGFVSAATMKPNDASMNAELKLHGLDKLLMGYGIDVKKNVVFDHGAQLRMQMLLPPAQVARVRHPAMAQLVDDPRFEDDEQLLQLVRRAIGPLGRRLDETSPMVDARLSDGSRLNAVIPPLTSGATHVTIRKFLLRARTLNDLVTLETVTPEAAESSRKSVMDRGREQKG